MLWISFAKFDKEQVSKFIDAQIQLNWEGRIVKVQDKLTAKMPLISWDTKLIAQIILDDLNIRLSKNNSKIIKREDVWAEYKWNLKDLFQNDQEIEDAIVKITWIIPQLAEYKWKLSDDKKLLEYLTLNTKYNDTDYKIRIYISLVKSIDTKNVDIENLSQRTNTIYADYQKNISFFQSEVNAFSDEKLDKIIANPIFKNYKPVFETIKLARENILSEDQESLLAELSDSHIPFSTVYSNLIDGDIKYPKIKDPQWNDVSTNYGNMYSAWNNYNREFRKEFTDKYYNTYKSFKNTLSSLFVSNVKEVTLKYKVRKYDSLIQAMYKHLYLPLETYDNLVDTTKKNLNTFHRYIKLRKDYMGLDKIHYYDTFIPLEKWPKDSYTYQYAKDQIISWLSKLWSEYLSGIITSFDSNWIDVYQSDDKSGGAYCAMTYWTHPYLLINFNNSFSNILELTHELGHAMNFHLTAKAQPSSLFGTIYPSEIPSIANELILLRWLANNTKSDKEKLFYLDRYLSTIYTNYWRATMYADFEKQIYTKAWNNEPINTQTLDELFKKLFIEYYGPDFEYDDYLDIERAIKPHFFDTYYTHVYALSTAAANKIATSVENQDAWFVNKYLEYLGSGQSWKPNELLQKIGIDMTKPEYIQSVSDTENAILDEMDTIIKRINSQK